MLFGQTGSIHFTLKNSSNETVSNVLVYLDSTLIGETDEKGKFSSDEIVTGRYTIRLDHISYQEKMIKIRVKENKYSKIVLILDDYTELSEEVSVVSDKINVFDPNPLSVTHIKIDEIKTMAGAEGDINRMLRVLPSVSDLGDFSNDMIVRGGNSSENAYFIDGIIMPDLSHFTRAGANGGFMSVTETDFVEDVDFYAGGYDAFYGQSLSSVTSMTYREGDKEDYHGVFGFSFMGANASIEGPINGGQGSWFLSGRRSFADPAMNEGENLILGNLQGKFNYMLSDKAKLSFINIYSKDKLDIDLDKRTEGTPRKAYNYDKMHNTMGFNLEVYENARSIWNFVISHSYIDNEFRSYFNRTDHVFLNYKSNNNILNAYFKNNTALSDRSNFEIGFAYKNEANTYDYTFDETLNYESDGVYNSLQKERFITSSIFMNFVHAFSDRFSTRLGIRGDYYSFNENHFISPRLSMSYLLKDNWRISTSYGVYNQNLSAALSMQNDKYKDIPSLISKHWILGTDYKAETYSFNVEYYIKNYTNLPFSDNRPTHLILDQNADFGELRYNGAITASGEGYTKGIDVLFQKQFTEKLNMTTSFSLFKSRYKDLYEKWRDRVFDNQTKINFSAIYDYSEKWSFSLSWAFNGGRPYTPIDPNMSLLYGETLDDSKANEVRYDDYHSLNLRIDRTFHFDQSDLKVYLSIWNLYNRQNIQNYFWDSANLKVAPEYQFPLLPWIGMKYTF